MDDVAAAKSESDHDVLSEVEEAFEGLLDVANPMKNKLNWLLLAFPIALWANMGHQQEFAFIFSMIAIMPLALLMVCIYIYLYVYMYIYIDPCTHAYMHTFIIYIHVCIHTCIHAYMHTCIHASGAVAQQI